MKKVFIKDLKIDKEEQLFCFVSNKRISKNIVFLDLYDSTGIIESIVVTDNKDVFEKARIVTKESAISVIGCLRINKTKKEFVISDLFIISKADITLSPSPNSKRFDVFDKKYARQVIEHPTFYIRNHKLSTVYKIKSNFKRVMQDYFWNLDFIEFESPTLTRQTLYDDSGAIWLDVYHQNISLSRCATFHLEPAIIPYERIFTITNSHADEKVKTNRHLVEYLHLKAEMCWWNLDELIKFAGKMYYEVAKETYNRCMNEINSIVGEKLIQEKIEKLNPKNHIHITYDQAVCILNEHGIDFEYGKSLTTNQEKILTKHFNENFVWVKYIPYTVEGFMFKRKEDNPFLTMTCDLIAPNGFGEILGCAEKMTSYEELISSMKEKNKFKDYIRYKDYAELHKFGLPPHGGIGMGIERALRYLLNIDHVKYTKPFAVIKGSQINH